MRAIELQQPLPEGRESEEVVRLGYPLDLRPRLFGCLGAGKGVSLQVGRLQGGTYHHCSASLRVFHQLDVGLWMKSLVTDRVPAFVRREIDVALVR